MATEAIPDPPPYLASAGTGYWRIVLGDWDLEPHLLDVLANASLQLDRIAACRNRVRRDGLTIEGPNGKPIAHPALSVERQAMKAHLQLVQALGLKDPPAPAPKAITPSGLKRGRPPKDSDYTPARAR